MIHSLHYIIPFCISIAYDHLPINGLHLPKNWVSNLIDWYLWVTAHHLSRMWKFPQYPSASMLTRVPLCVHLFMPCLLCLSFYPWNHSLQNNKNKVGTYFVHFVSSPACFYHWHYSLWKSLLNIAIFTWLLIDWEQRHRPVINLAINSRPLIITWTAACVYKPTACLSLSYLVHISLNPCGA